MENLEGLDGPWGQEWISQVSEQGSGETGTGPKGLVVGVGPEGLKCGDPGTQGVVPESKVELLRNRFCEKGSWTLGWRTSRFGVKILGVWVIPESSRGTLRSRKKIPGFRRHVLGVRMTPYGPKVPDRRSWDFRMECN